MITVMHATTMTAHTDVILIDQPSLTGEPGSSLKRELSHSGNTSTDRDSFRQFAQVSGAQIAQLRADRRQFCHGRVSVHSGGAGAAPNEIDGLPRLPRGGCGPGPPTPRRY